MKKATYFAATMAAVLFTGTTVFAAPLQTQTVSCKNTVIFSNSDWKSICSADDLKALLERLCKGQLPETPDCPETPDAPITPDVPSTPDAPTAPDVPTTPDVPDSSEDEADVHPYVLKVVELVNKERKSAGLNPVTLNTDATTAAQVRAEESSVSFSHTRPDGTSFATALKDAGVSYRSCGENIAWGQKTPEQVMEGWMNSAGHRANILNASYTEIGVGFYQNASGVNYWSQLFIY